MVVDKDSGMRISRGPLREGLGRAYVVGLGSVVCSEDEREGPCDVEAYAQPNPRAARPVRGGAGAAISVGVDPGGEECAGLVDELLRAGYIQHYPSPSLTAHGLYRLTDSGVSAAEDAALAEARRRAQRNEGRER